MAADLNDGLSTKEADAAAKAAAKAVTTDEFGRPVLPPAQPYLDALSQGYYGNDGPDLGAAVHPEDVRSFQEHADAQGHLQPAHSEPVVIENPGGTAGGYSALGAPNAPAPVLGGDATAVDAPSQVTSPAGTSTDTTKES